VRRRRAIALLLAAAAVVGGVAASRSGSGSAASAATTGSATADPISYSAASTTPATTSAPAGDPVTLEWVGDMVLGSSFGMPPDNGRRSFAAVVHTLLAAYIRWQVWFNLTPLLITQPKQIAAHQNDSESRRNRITNRFSRQCFY